MREGIITKVFPNKHGIESATEYEWTSDISRPFFITLNCALLGHLSAARVRETGDLIEKIATRGVSYSRRRFLLVRIMAMFDFGGATPEDARSQAPAIH
jgi:hypothetical protein